MSIVTPTEVRPVEILFRRFESYCRIIDSDGRERVASAAFKDRKKKPDVQCSVYRSDYETKESALAHSNQDHYGVAAFPASVPLEITELFVKHMPLEDAPGHTEIYGLTRIYCAVLAEQCQIVIQPKVRTIDPDS